MAKRKAVRRPKKKIKYVIPKKFDCTLCNHKSSVIIKLKHDDGVGYLECVSCYSTYRTTLNNLTEPIDIYHSWIDACEEGETGRNALQASRSTRGYLEEDPDLSPDKSDTGLHAEEI